jgi:hypothetical protein
MANNFRNHHPQRTCTEIYAGYRSFKPHLATDFKNKCGYTDCSDFWFGGMGNFHIDHFVPWKSYPGQPNLKTDYSNLVYCCSYVNILKSNDETDYIDPCNVDFNQHFSRGIDGTILPNGNSSAANYMFKKLKLYMLRYRIIWMLDSINDRMEKLEIAINDPKNAALKISLQVVHSDLATELRSYIRYLRANQ